jgi:outer membrane lipoprotein-sorting protein
MKCKPGLIFFYFMIMGSFGFSQGSFSPMNNQSVFKDKFAVFSKNTSTIQAGFTQEKEMRVLAEKIVTKGRFMFKKENKLRWEYTEPFHYLIIFYNGMIVIKDEDKKNKIDTRTNKMFSEINNLILGCVQGNLFNDQKKFLPAFLENSTSYLVKLKPIESTLKEYLSEIRIYFDKNDMSVSRLEMQEPSGDYTNIQFSGKKINMSIADEKFIVN